MDSAGNNTDKRLDRSKTKGSRAGALGRRAFLKRAFVGLPVLAVPAVAGGSLLTSLGLRAGKGRPLSRTKVRALRQRFLAEARGREKPLLVDAEAAGGVARAEVRLVSRGNGGAVAVSPPARPAPPTERNILVRMRLDLERALAKPADQRKWTMVIDLRKCIGCSACSVACKAENHLPPGIVYRPVIEEEEGTYPNVARTFLPRPCMQCEHPPCTPVCPVGATWKQEDGIVVIDYEKCIGCRYCIAACPYGARYFDFGTNYTDGTPARQPYEESVSPEYGKEWRRNGTSSPIGNVRKCQFCLHRLNVGMLPACVTTCLGGATYFGDQNDPESLVSELLASGRTMRLKEELGTRPKVYYLI